MSSLGSNLPRRGTAVLGVAVALASLGASQAEAQSGEPSLTASILNSDRVKAVRAEAMASTSAAQDADPDTAFLTFFRKTELSALADMYFHFNFNDPEPGTPTALRNFDSSHNQFSFALVELALSKPAVADSRVGFRLDLDYGEVAKTVNSFEPAGATLENVQQGYLSYLAPVGSGLTLDIGKFVTPMGAEVIESKDNWNYSRSFLFALAIPYYHMGARLSYAPTDKVSFMGSVSNGWNNITDTNSQRTYHAAATLKPVAPLSVIANFIAGPEQSLNTDDWRKVFDATVSVAVNDKFSLMGNYDYGTEDIDGETVTWQGVALYAKAQPTSTFALSPRFEIYKDEDGFTTGLAQTVKEATLTAEIKHSHGLLMRLEFRRDWSDEDYFVKGTDAVDGQNTFTVGLVYSFSTKAP